MKNDCTSISGPRNEKILAFFRRIECKLRFKYELERASRFCVTVGVCTRDLATRRREKQRGEAKKRIRKNCIRLRSRSIFIRVEVLLPYSSRGGLGKQGFHSRNTFLSRFFLLRVLRPDPSPRVAPFFRINRMQMRSRQ